MKTDLRVIKSKQAIENTFIQLVEIKGFANISVKEIAEKAMVNRNTIYINYGSKEGILESIIKNSILNKIGDISQEEIRKITLNKKRLADMYRKFFSAIDENIELYRILLTDAASKGYFETEAYKINKNLNEVFKQTPANETRISFLLSGIFGIIRNYIIFAKQSEEETIRILTDTTITIIRQIMYSK